MPRAVTRVAEAWTHVLKRDRDLPPEEQSRFTLRPMAHWERAATRDNLSRVQLLPDGSKVVVERTRQEAFAIALNHIVAVENFPVGAPQPWPEDRAGRIAMLEQLEDDDVMELGNAVFYRSDAGGPVVGNSSPPGRTSSSGGSSAVEISTPAPAAPNNPS